MEDAPFRPEQYSRLKFGCDEAAREMGYQIADAFFQNNAPALLDSRSLMISSPYNFVPNAATIMTMHLLNRLNSHIVDAKGNHVEYATVPRKISYVNDYGLLSGEHRKSLIAGDRFYFNSQHFEGRCLLFVDDVKITGTHENRLVELMHEQQLKNKTFFLYLIFPWSAPLRVDMCQAADLPVCRCALRKTGGGSSPIVFPMAEGVFGDAMALPNATF
ncbi:hypothetical protein EHS39_35650 [Ensifer sp. MPMI2T]|nr:hypothetical protein EHS39_35650 [Ensifer sp. MPMI2T]